MRIILKILLLFISVNIHAKDMKSDLKEFLDNKWQLSKEALQGVIDGEILVDVDVKELDNDKKQNFKMRALGIHPKGCHRLLRKLSRPEDLSQWLDFVKKSTYNDSNKLLTIQADHILLPFPMLVHIIIDRPTKPGLYNFTFPTGIFTGLTGTMEIRVIENRCLIYSSSSWEGKHTGINNIIIDIFATTLSKIGAEILVRKTLF